MCDFAPRDNFNIEAAIREFAEATYGTMRNRLLPRLTAADSGGPPGESPPSGVAAAPVAGGAA